MKLYRKVDDTRVTEWLDHFSDCKAFPKKRYPPVWSLSTFLPSAKDKDSWVSFWGIDNGISLTDVAAAESYLTSANGSAYIGVDLAAIEGAGLAVRTTAGSTVVSRVNLKHYEIQISESSTLFTVTRLFSSGKFVQVEKKDIEKARSYASRNSWPEYQKIAEKNDPVSSLKKMIAAKEVKIFGADLVP